MRETLDALAKMRGNGELPQDEFHAWQHLSAAVRDSEEMEAALRRDLETAEGACESVSAELDDAAKRLTELEAQLKAALDWKESAMNVLAEWHAARELIGEDRIGWGPKQWASNVKAQLAEAKAVLRDIQWSDSSACPVCYRYEATEWAVAKGLDNLGHAPDCRLKKVLDTA